MPTFLDTILSEKNSDLPPMGKLKPLKSNTYVRRILFVLALMGIIIGNILILAYENLNALYWTVSMFNIVTLVVLSIIYILDLLRKFNIDLALYIVSVITFIMLFMHASFTQYHIDTLSHRDVIDLLVIAEYFFAFVPLIYLSIGNFSKVTYKPVKTLSKARDGSNPGLISIRDIENLLFFSCCNCAFILLVTFIKPAIFNDAVDSDGDGIDDMTFHEKISSDHVIVCWVYGIDCVVMGFIVLLRKPKNELVVILLMFKCFGISLTMWIYMFHLGDTWDNDTIKGYRALGFFAMIGNIMWPFLPIHIDNS